MTNSNDQIFNLFIIDKYLFNSQTSLSNIWRNFLKLILIPIQLYLLYNYTKKNKTAIYFANGIYYSFLLSFMNIKYISTPQGSEILLRIHKSYFYKLFCHKALSKALIITVDSVSMQKKIFEFYNINAKIVQNGIDINNIINTKRLYPNLKRTHFLSVRGFTSLYRINEIVESRNFCSINSVISFSYPFFDTQYKNYVINICKPFDIDYGYLSKDIYYKTLLESKVIFSIPISDSSPRSVYEAIFSGCIVVITYNPYIDMIPIEMKSRIIVVDMNDKNWFKNAIDIAEIKLKSDFKINNNLLELYDQNTSFNRILNLF